MESGGQAREHDRARGRGSRIRNVELPGHLVSDSDTPEFDRRARQHRRRESRARHNGLRLAGCRAVKIPEGECLRKTSRL